VPEIFGRHYDRHALEIRIGDAPQLGGITPILYDEGRARGTSGFLLRTGGGLEVEIVADRALDVVSATYRGIPLTWRGPGGLAHPAYSSLGINAFERNFFGGLMTTCGLQAFGPAGSDVDGAWQEHGYINHAPAQSVTHRALWGEDDCTFEITGTVREARMFGAALRLERTWRAELGGTTLRLHDRVTNEGGESTPHMLLYHCNAGFPLLDVETELSVTHLAVPGRPAAERLQGAGIHSRALRGRGRLGARDRVEPAAPRWPRSGFGRSLSPRPVAGPYDVAHAGRKDLCDGDGAG
jgi:hypothetical protein